MNDDFLDEIIEERTKTNPDFPGMVRKSGHDAPEEDMSANQDSPFGRCAAGYFPPEMFCTFERGHHGPHVSHGGYKWENANEASPCPSTNWAVLGLVEAPARVRCGLIEGHDGQHVMSIAWRAP